MAKKNRSIAVLNGAIECLESIATYQGAANKAITALSQITGGYAPTVTQMREAKNAIHLLMFFNKGPDYKGAANALVNLKRQIEARQSRPINGLDSDQDIAQKVQERPACSEVDTTCCYCNPANSNRCCYCGKTESESE